ncbi:MAG: enoyl-CoA hydratase-related protein [Bacteroidota bacterium]
MVKKEAQLARITLNRPPANGYYDEFLQSLYQILSHLESEGDVKVVTIESGIDKFFCAGADIKIFASKHVDGNKAMVVAAREVARCISESAKIYVAAIQGHTLGGGLELAMACDIRLAAKGNYLIGLPEIKLGQMPGNGGAVRLVQLLGKSRATELLLTGDSITPEKAFDYGLFNHLYEAVTFEKELDSYLHKLANGSRTAMKMVKNFLERYEGKSPQELLAWEKECVDQLYDTEDAKEGFRAFTEKRKPRFK